VKEDGRGEKKLVGYVELGEEKVGREELQRYMKERVPEYMVPGEIVVIEEMPRSVSGKIERKRLEEMEEVREEGEKEREGARTPIEEVLVGIWSEVLEREEIGIEENFFEMGGHSLLATRVNSWIREAFEVEMSVGALFETPTIRELGERIEGEIRERRGLEGPGIERVERGEGGEVLSYAQQRLWFMDQMERGSGLYNVPCAVRLKGEMKEEAMRRALSEIVRRHEVMRTVFREERGEGCRWWKRRRKWRWRWWI